MKEIISLSILILLASGCKRGKEGMPSSPEIRQFKSGSKSWSSEVKVQEIGSMTFKAAMVPVEYYISNQNRNKPSRNIDSLSDSHRRERIVEFLIGNDREEDILQPKFTNLDYQQSVNYLSSDIARDFYVVTSSNDTVPCSGVLYERTYKVTPYTKLLLFFSDIDPEDRIQLVYNDALYGKGNVKLRFSNSTKSL